MVSDVGGWVGCRVGYGEAEEAGDFRVWDAEGREELGGVVGQAREELLERGWIRVRVKLDEANGERSSDPYCRYQRKYVCLWF